MNSSESQLLIDTVRQFADEKVRPITEELDETERFPEEIYAELGEMGLLGITVPEEDYGAGGTTMDYLNVMEELSRGYASVADQVGVIELVGNLISHFGTQEQKDRYLPGLFAAKIRCSYGLTEPTAGSDLGGLKSTARKDGSDYILNGEKIYIHNAPVADVAMVLARTNPDKGKRGMSMFLVDIATPGVERAYKEHKMGQRASPVGGFVFTDVRLPASAMLGEEGTGFSAVLSGLEKGRLGIGALASGISRAALDTAVEYSQQRQQFGSRIADFQAVAFTLADMKVDYDAGRGLLERAALLLDAKKDANAACSEAKLFASEAAIRNTNRAVQVLGGGGYIRGVEAERLYRDARITAIYEGTSEVQRLVIARSLVGKS